MRRLLPVLVLGLIALSAVGAFADTIISYNGNSWETGGFPPSIVGDEFQAVGDVTDVIFPLTWDTVLYQYTWYAWDLFSLGESVSGDEVTVLYTTGQYQIYVDDFFPLGTDRDYANAPATFTDATADPNYLHGNFNSFKVVYNTTSNTGNWEGTLVFDSGTFVNSLGTQDGYTFAATVGPPFPPVGYDLEGGGDIFLTPTGTESKTWGAIKGLYQD